MTKTHLIADEKLGGVQREFIEVERKAKVGDYVINNKGTEDEAYYEVTGYSDKFCPLYNVDYSGKENDDDYTIAVSIDRSITLEPTDIVAIDGTRYHLVERKAKIGEMVLVVKLDSALDYKLGDVFKVDDVAKDCVDMVDNIGDVNSLYHHEYRVLIPVKSDWQALLEGENYMESEELLVTVDATQCSEAVIDMLANLARRVTELESQLKSPSPWATQEDVIELNGKVEMCIDDIVTLDERTQPLVEPKQAAEAILRKIAKLIEEEGVGI